MQQYFVKGLASSPVTIEDKETSKHMFQVMRLKEDDEVTLVFDDGIKRLARVVNVESRQLELIEELADNVEQSKRNLVPSITLFEKKSDFLAQLDQFDRIVVAYEESAKEGEAAALLQSLTGLEAGSKLLFIFGPEGGLSPAEIESFTVKGAILAGLGPRILRAETAPLYALSAVSVVTELMN